MEISPILLFTLLFYSFVWGIMIGVLNDINRILRTLIYNENISPRMQKYYDIKLPLVNFTLRDRLSSKKKIKPTYTLLLFVQDLGIVLVYVIGLLFLNYSLNKGNFRFFTVITSVIGILLYYFTAGKLIFSLSEFICFAIKVTVTFILFVIFSPFVYILTKIQKIFEKIYIFFQKSIAKYIKKSYNNYKEKELLRWSENSFLRIKK